MPKERNSFIKVILYTYGRGHPQGTLSNVRLGRQGLYKKALSPIGFPEGWIIAGLLKLLFPCLSPGPQCKST